MKRYLTIIIIIGMISAGLVFSTGALAVEEVKGHKIVEISGSNQELFNYPLKIRLAKLKAGKKSSPYQGEAGWGKKSIGEADKNKVDVCLEDLKDDFSDARFSAPDGQTPLSYYLERVYQQDGLLLADFWVKIPQLPKAGIKMHIYSANKEAKDESNPQSVFLFFDDFNSPILDEQKWQVRLDLESKYSLKDGELELKNCSIISRAFKMKSGILEFKAKAGENSTVQAIVKKSSPYQGEAGWGKGGIGQPRYAIEHLVYSSGYPGAEHTIAINDLVKVNSGIPIKPHKEYIYKVSASEATGEIIFERYGSDYQKQAEIRFLGADNSWEGSIGLKSTTAFPDRTGAYFDWVRVRPDVEIKPEIKEIKE